MTRKNLHKNNVSFQIKTYFAVYPIIHGFSMKKKSVLFASLFSSVWAIHAEERPNIILIMCDDMGYSDLGCFGSEIRTPNIDSLASHGLRFTQFYNCGRSCPTRASLMTGLYAHQAGMGEMVNDRHLPGYRGDLSSNSVTIAEVLKRAGYNTYMSGKWHVTNVPYGENMQDASKHNWPLQRGFERFYGTLHGAGNYWDPSALVRDNQYISPYQDKEYTPQESYYYTNAISDNAVRYIKEHNPQKPFFLYVAYTAPHWPMQAPEETINSYNGVYDEGYEQIREARYQHMVSNGIIDSSWNLSEQAGNWSESTNKEWEKRLMQTYAAMITLMDEGVGKIVQELKRNHLMENTLILFLQDNGGCAEEVGRKYSIPSKEEMTPHGKEWLQNFGRKVTRDGRVIRTGTETLSGPEDTFIAYGKFWANVSNTPFREYKQFVHEGGISTPLIAHWPKGIHETNGIRHSPGHVIDIMATCVALSQKNYPETYNGHSIVPYEGKSLLPLFEKEQTENRILLFEHYGNAAIRIGKWKLVGKGMITGNEIKEDGWELYDMEKDRSETNNLSQTYPEKVKELLATFKEEAKRTWILPKE